MPLGVAQRLFDKKEKLTGIGVKLKDLSRIDGFSARVFEIPSVQVITMAQVQRTLLDLLGHRAVFHRNSRHRSRGNCSTRRNEYHANRGL